MKDNLKIITDLKKTYLYLDKIVSNYPNNEKVLKDKIRSNMLEVIEICYLANELNDRKLLQKKVIIKMKMIDFYFKISLDKKYINYKKYLKISNYLLK